MPPRSRVDVLTQARTPPHLVQGRSCDGCTVCCKLLAIGALAKPRHVWCQHCDVGKGCRIHGSHPDECGAFYCGYLLNANLGDHWKPITSRMVVGYELPSNRTVVHVDAGRSNAWRKEPFYSELKRWAAAAVERGGLVVVYQGLDAVVVFPDREQNLGRVTDDQVIAVSVTMGPNGPVRDAILLSKDDPRVRAQNS